MAEMPETLGARWFRFIEAIRSECLEHDQDPGVLESSFDQMKVTLPLDGASRFRWEFSTGELQAKDPVALARAFYRAYRKAGGTPPIER